MGRFGGYRFFILAVLFTVFVQSQAYATLTFDMTGTYANCKTSFQGSVTEEQKVFLGVVPNQLLVQKFQNAYGRLEFGIVKVEHARELSGFPFSAVEKGSNLPSFDQYFFDGRKVQVNLKNKSAKLTQSVANLKIATLVDFQVAGATSFQVYKTYERTRVGLRSVTQIIDPERNVLGQTITLCRASGFYDH